MRKKILLISLTVGFVFLGVFCYKTWIVTFALTNYLSGRADGRQGIVKSIVIPWRSYQIHLHHWFLALVIGGVVVVRGFYVVAPEISYGFLSAIIFQGIYCYKDWYRLIKKRHPLPILCQQVSSAPVNELEPIA